MRKLTFCFLFLSIIANADPFFGEAEQHKPEHLSSQTEFAKNQENLTACKPAEQSFNKLSELNLAVEFEKLKLIGIVKIHNQFRALFIDEKNQLFDFKENEFISQQQIEIRNINLKSVTYINWKLTQNCNLPYEIILKL